MPWDRKRGDEREEERLKKRRRRAKQRKVAQDHADRSEKATQMELEARLARLEKLAAEELDALDLSDPLVGFPQAEVSRSEAERLAAAEAGGRSKQKKTATTRPREDKGRFSVGRDPSSGLELPVDPETGRFAGSLGLIADRDRQFIEWALGQVVSSFIPEITREMHEELGYPRAEGVADMLDELIRTGTGAMGDFLPETLTENLGKLLIPNWPTWDPEVSEREWGHKLLGDLEEGKITPEEAEEQMPHGRDYHTGLVDPYPDRPGLKGASMPQRRYKGKGTGPLYASAIEDEQPPGLADYIRAALSMIGIGGGTMDFQVPNWPPPNADRVEALNLMDQYAWPGDAAQLLQHLAKRGIGGLYSAASALPDWFNEPEEWFDYKVHVGPWGNIFPQWEVPPVHSGDVPPAGHPAVPGTTGWVPDPENPEQPWEVSRSTEPGLRRHAQEQTVETYPPIESEREQPILHEVMQAGRDLYSRELAEILAGLIEVTESPQGRELIEQLRQAQGNPDAPWRIDAFGTNLWPDPEGIDPGGAPIIRGLRQGPFETPREREELEAETEYGPPMSNFVSLQDQGNRPMITPRMPLPSEWTHTEFPSRRIVDSGPMVFPRSDLDLDGPTTFPAEDWSQWMPSEIQGGPGLVLDALMQALVSGGFPQQGGAPGGVPGGMPAPVPAFAGVPGLPPMDPLLEEALANSANQPALIGTPYGPFPAGPQGGMDQAGNLIAQLLDLIVPGDQSSWYR